eukprot:365213-Chlamydomonas_euryale.AAC.11
MALRGGICRAGRNALRPEEPEQRMSGRWLTDVCLLRRAPHVPVGSRASCACCTEQPTHQSAYVHVPVA